jgi:hypothetical protein
MVRFADALRVRVPAGLPDAIEIAARRRHTTSSEWLRQALLRNLENEGLFLRESGRIEQLEPTAGLPCRD